jgi:pyruvate/2-oxoglutarate dehydrogenase complex dihydrolipoamide acyltransferase (E2) component
VALQNAAVSKIRAEYVAGVITQAEATVALGAALVPTAAHADLFVFWDVERSVTIHKVTPAQVVGAYRRGVITAADCKARLLAEGVQAGNLAIVVADGYPPTHPAAAQAAATAVVNA